MSQNSCMLIGRLGKDPESKNINGKTLTSFSIGVNRGQKDSEGNYISDWFNCESWNQTAETISKIVTKGCLISVQGSIKIDKYEKDGKTNYITKIAVNSFSLLNNPNKSNNQGNNSSNNSSNYSKSNNNNNSNYQKQSRPTANQLNEHFDNFEDDIPPF